VFASDVADDGAIAQRFCERAVFATPARTAIAIWRAMMEIENDGTNAAFETLQHDAAR